MRTRGWQLYKGIGQLRVGGLDPAGGNAGLRNQSALPPAMVGRPPVSKALMGDLRPMEGLLQPQHQSHLPTIGTAELLVTSAAWHL